MYSYYKCMHDYTVVIHVNPFFGFALFRLRDEE